MTKSKWLVALVLFFIAVQPSLDLKIEIQSLIGFKKTRPIIFRANKSVVLDRVVQVFDVRKTQE